MKPLLVTYGNCQLKNIVDYVTRHPALVGIYDTVSIGNFGLIQEQGAVPYETFAKADIVLYQPTADVHGPYATSEILKHCKPGCIQIAIPYIYNYSFWEVLVFADGDYKVGHSAMRYAHLNHGPITRLREQGLSFDAIERLILAKEFDWDFARRYAETQSVLRKKEADCDVKVSDFIDAHHKDTLLFYTQNHPARPVLRHAAEQVLRLLGHDPAELPEELPLPDYAPNTEHPEIPIGWFAWKHFGFTFIPEPGPETFPFIVYYAKQIYDGRTSQLTT